MDAFLKARGRNLAEEIKLQSFMLNLELEKKQWEKRIFNQMYEDQTNAFALKKSSNEIKKKKEELIFKKKGIEIKPKKIPPPKFELPDIRFLTNSLVAEDGDFGELSERKKSTRSARKTPEPIETSSENKVAQPAKALPAIKMTGGFSKISITVKKKKERPPPPMPVPSEGLPDISLSNNVVLPAIKLETSAYPGLVSKDGGDSRSDVLNQSLSSMKFANVVEKLLGRKGEEESSVGQNEDEAYPSPRAASERFGKFSLIGPAPKKINLKELVDRLFPKTLRKARSMEQLEKLKTMDVIEPEEKPEKVEVTKEESDAGKEDEEMDRVIIVDDFWVGDPNAIGSVRRGRLAPEVMNARSKNMGDVMKLIRDLPMYPSCSRNCNRPGVIMDTMVAGEPQMMLPSLAKANVKRYNQKMKMRQAIENVAIAVKAVAEFNKPIQPPVSEMNLPSVQKVLEKKVVDKQRSLRKTTRELRKSLKKATERQTVKSSQQVVVGEQGARVQIAYTFDPVSRLRGPKQNKSKQVEKIK